MKYTALLSIVAAQVQRPGPCPKVPDQPDFDVEKYLGVWFTFMTNDFINVPTNSECVAATYGFKNENAITGKSDYQSKNLTFLVNNTEVLNVEIRGENYPIPSYAFGQAEIVDPEHPTRLLVSFEEFGGCGAQVRIILRAFK